MSGECHVLFQPRGISAMGFPAHVRCSIRSSPPPIRPKMSATGCEVSGSRRAWYRRFLRERSGIVPTRGRTHGLESPCHFNHRPHFQLNPCLQPCEPAPTRQPNYVRPTSNCRLVGTHRLRRGAGQEHCRCRALVRWLSPAILFCKRVNVFLARAQEIEEVHTPVFAGLADAEQDQISLDTIFCRDAVEYMAKFGERFDRVFSVVVVPRNPIVIEKREEVLAMLFETRPEFHGYFTPDLLGNWFLAVSSG